MIGYKNLTNVCSKPVPDCEVKELQLNEPFPIGDRAIHVQIYNWHGMRFDIRHFFYHEHQKTWLPKRKGVCLSKMEYMELKTIIHDVYPIMEAKERYLKYGVQLEDHIGVYENEKLIPVGDRGVHVKISVFEGSTRCHIRFFNSTVMGKGLYPTLKGVALNIDELQTLIECLAKCDELMQVNEPKKRCTEWAEKKTAQVIEPKKRCTEWVEKKPTKKRVKFSTDDQVLYGGPSTATEYIPDYEGQSDDF